MGFLGNSSPQYFSSFITSDFDEQAPALFTSSIARLSDFDGICYALDCGYIPSCILAINDGSLSGGILISGESCLINYDDEHDPLSKHIYVWCKSSYFPVTTVEVEMKLVPGDGFVKSSSKWYVKASLIPANNASVLSDGDAVSLKDKINNFVASRK